MGLRVLLADDHALFRDGIASLLATWGMEVVGQAGDGMEALEQARRLRPDLILMDIKMPRCDGITATRLIRAEMPDIRIVILTVSEDDQDLFEAIKSGAHGYLLKHMRGDEFGLMLAGLQQGDVPMSRGLARKVLSEFARKERAAAEPSGESLTDREREVLRQIAGGATNKEIGTTLHISEHTVNYHVKNILGKLHVRNRAQAAAYAIREGLTEKPPQPD